MTANCRSKSIASALLLIATTAFAQTQTQTQAPAPTQAPKPTQAPAPTPVGALGGIPPTAAAAAAPRATDPVVPAGYVIGTDDVLSIVYWKDKDMSSDAKVRPDGRIALPLINEVQAAGLTPEQLHSRLVEESKKYMEDAS